MANDLISRNTLIEKMNDTGVHIELNLPVEEILGEDIDIDDFCMLLQDAIQSYRKMIIGVIKDQPTVNGVDAVVEQMETLYVSDAENKWSKTLRKVWNRAIEMCIRIVKGGGKDELV